MRQINLKYVQCFILCFFLCCSQNIFSQQINNYNVYGNSSDVLEISCVETPNHVFVAAVFDNPTNTGFDIVVILRSLDYGITWDSVTTLYQDSLYQGYIDPFLSCDSVGNIFLCAMRGIALTTYNGHNTWILKSPDDGLTWTFQGFSPNQGPNGGTDFPRTKAWGNNTLALCYLLVTSGTTNVSITRSLDGGITWSPVDSIEGNGQFIGGSSLNQSSGNKLFMSYSNKNTKNIYFTFSIDSGLTLEPSVLVGSYNTLGYFYLTSMLANKNNSQKGIISHAAHNFENTYYFHSLNGVNWSSTLVDSSSGYSEGFIDDNGIVHVAYCKISNGIYYLYYRYSVDSGFTFSFPLAVDSNLITLPLQYAKGDYLSIFKAGDAKIHITWCDIMDSTTIAKHSIITSPILSVFNPIEVRNPSFLFNLQTHLLQVLNENSKYYLIEIIDVLGKIVFQKNTNENKFVINTENYSHGTYIISLTDDKGFKFSQKIIL